MTDHHPPDATDAAPPAARALPRGTVVDGFEIVRTLADTPVSVVYLAIELARDTEVVLKEYMPQRLARREGSQMRPLLASEAALLERGLQSFIGEGEMLAEIEDAALVRVLRVIAANATAYHVMPHLGGTPLLQLREEMLAPPDEVSLRAVLDGLLGALDALHRRQLMHGAVSPHNILLLADDRPLLLGPGLAQAEIASGLVESLMASVEPSFAAPEQLDPHPWRPVGPWTDLYSLAETMRFCLSGELPLPAGHAVDPRDRESIDALIRRLYGDASATHYSRALLDGLKAALNPDPAARPQSVEAFRHAIGALPAPDAFGIDLDVDVPLATGARVDPAFDLPAASAGDATSAAAAEPASLSSYLSAPSAPVAPPAAKAATPPTMATPARPSATPAPRATAVPPRPATAPPARRVGLWASSALAALALAGAYAWWYRAPSAAPAAPTPPPSARGVVLEATPAASAPTPMAATPATTETTAAPAPAAAPATAHASAPVPVAAPTSAPAESPAPTSTATAVPAPEPAPAATPAPPPARETATLPPPRDLAPPATTASRAVTPPAAAERAKPSAASPREACAGRTQFATYRCMQTQCALAAWTRHPQCERLRATDSVDD